MHSCFSICSWEFNIFRREKKNPKTCAKSNSLRIFSHLLLLTDGWIIGMRNQSRD